MLGALATQGIKHLDQVRPFFNVLFQLFTSPLGSVIPIRVSRLVRRIKGQWAGHRCLQ